MKLKLFVIVILVLGLLLIVGVVLLSYEVFVDSNNGYKELIMDGKYIVFYMILVDGIIVLYWIYFVFLENKKVFY